MIILLMRLKYGVVDLIFYSVVMVWTIILMLSVLY